jgi:sulfonate transport system substrate-binding protein
VSDSVADAVLRRTDLSSVAIGDAARTAIVAAGDVLKKSGIVRAETDVPDVARTLIDPSFVSRGVSRGAADQAAR